MTQSRGRKIPAQEIDRHLRRAFQEITDEALPPQLADLLERLKAGEAAATGKAGREDRS